MPNEAIARSTNHASAGDRQPGGHAGAGQLGASAMHEALLGKATNDEREQRAEAGRELAKHWETQPPANVPGHGLTPAA